MDMRLTDPLVGRLLEDRYMVESFIAHGGMATVYLATDNRLERRVAVKVLHAHLCDDADTVARFEREARSAARLSSPEIVAIYDQGNDIGRAFLVMEYVPGVNLRHLIRERGRLTPGEALAVMDHVLSALATAHAAGLIHRDVKPENVLVTADGRVKLADFGLARAVAGSTVTTTGSVLLGTAAYLSPEQFLHGTADARSDVYSAGVMLFELLTGTPPFTADNANALLNRHVNEDIPAPSTRAAGIAPQVNTLVTWSTSRDPRERPADAGELHTSLVEIRDRLGLHDRVPALPVALTQRIADQTTGPVPGGSTTTGRVPAARPARSVSSPRKGGRPGDVTQVVAGSRPPPARTAPVAKRRRRRWPFVALLGAIIVALAAVGGWWFAEGRYTTVPTNLVGDSRSQAVQALTAAGLHPKWLSPVHSDTLAKGKVATVSPSGRILHGGTVDLQLSLGKVTHVVPSLQNKSVAAATSALKDLHFTVAPDEDKEFSTQVAKGDVIATTPPAGQREDEGQSITLEVSKGPQLVKVPAVVNQTAEDAEAALSQAGFEFHERDIYSDTIDAGLVISANPLPGHRVVKGRTINLNVSKGPKLYPVPNVEGDLLADAIRILRNAGFVPVPTLTFPDGPGKVDRETPTGMQKRGTQIELDYF